MKFYKDGLSKRQIGVLKKLSPLMQKDNFYLAGGTALAIYFGHRISVDLDWFSSKPFGNALLLAKKIQNEQIDLKIEETSLGTLHGFISNVRVTFLEYQYPLLSKPILWEETSCILASLEDLACMKLSAIAQRGARKDFCDIYALGKTFSLQEMLTFYSKKFNIQNISHVLYGLSYFDDAEQERMPKMLWDVSWKEIKQTIQEWVKQLAS
jgi:predicted nucleotidyltransferase component of viral defense system